MNKAYILFLIAMASFGCISKKSNEDNKSGQLLLNNITIQTFANDSVLGGFGYDLLVDGKIMVHQPNIPAVMGNRGFVTEADAQKTAALVKHKLQNNIMPPSVTIQELDSIGIK